MYVEWIKAPYKFMSKVKGEIHETLKKDFSCEDKKISENFRDFSVFFFFYTPVCLYMKYLY